MGYLLPICPKGDKFIDLDNLSIGGMMKYFVRTTQQLALILQGCRKETGASQKQTASKVGLLPKTISALETNPDTSSIVSLFKLLSALGLEMVLQPKDADFPRKCDW